MSSLQFFQFIFGIIIPHIEHSRADISYTSNSVRIQYSLTPSTVSSVPDINVVLGPGASVIGNKWFINVTSQQSADLIIEFGPTWGWNADHISEARFNFRGNTTQSTYDNDGEMLWVFSSGDQYFAQEISLDSTRTPYKQCPSHNEPLISRNVSSMISGTIPDRYYRFCNNTEGISTTNDYWTRHETLYREPLQWDPMIGFDITNDPIAGEIDYEQWDLNGGGFSFKTRSHYASAFPANQGWKWYISGGSINTAFWIFDMNLVYEFWTPEPTLSPSFPTNNPTNTPSISPTNPSINEPSTSPIAAAPTQSPASKSPTADPSINLLLDIPSPEPTNEPSTSPITATPTQSPLTKTPTADPTSYPLALPIITTGHTFDPSTSPTMQPSIATSKFSMETTTTMLPSFSPIITLKTDVDSSETGQITSTEQHYNPTAPIESNSSITNPHDKETSTITINMIIIGSSSVFFVMCCVIIILVYVLYSKKKSDRKILATHIQSDQVRKNNTSIMSIEKESDRKSVSGNLEPQILNPINSISTSTVLDTIPGSISHTEPPLNLMAANSINSISVVSDDCKEIETNEGYKEGENDIMEKAAENKPLPPEDHENRNNGEDQNLEKIYATANHEFETSGNMVISTKGNTIGIDIQTPGKEDGNV